jgi:hypothetical protein
MHPRYTEEVQSPELVSDRAQERERSEEGTVEIVAEIDAGFSESTVVAEERIAVSENIGEVAAFDMIPLSACEKLVQEATVSSR